MKKIVLIVFVFLLFSSRKKNDLTIKDLLAV